MTNNLDASIPVLTEVIAPAKAPTPPAAVHASPQAHIATPATPATPPAAPATLLTQPTAASAAKPAEAHTPHSATAALAQLTPKEWEQLEHRLAERVLKQLQGRIEFVLEQRVRDSLADVLQLALVGLTGEIKRGLQQTLEEVIARAVQQEISRLQSLKK
jgi:hypothetical protein